ncbi:MAG TPA: hypothetical protein VIJ30_01680, partial [Candidatus Dormibacteraeota bacterium]
VSNSHLFDDRNALPASEAFEDADLFGMHSRGAPANLLHDGTAEEQWDGRARQPEARGESTPRAYAGRVNRVWRRVWIVGRIVVAWPPRNVTDG